MSTETAVKEKTHTDEEIVKRILKGEKHLYEKLMRKYNQRLYRVAMSIINDDMEAEDLMQTAYLNAYTQLHTFQNKSGFSTWLTRILINESLQRKKKLSRERELTNENEEIHFNTPLKGLMNEELKAILERSISQLPDKYRTVFVMREIEELSTSETMETLNLSESNVKVRLNRAKTLLREQLGSYYKSGQLFDFNLVRCDKVVNYVMARI
jgi:RNA polymerase sigma factor (sigma-70 family)